MIVRDVQTTVDFYTRALGFRLVQHAPGPDGLPAWALLRRGDVALLFESRAGWPANVVPLVPSEATVTFHLDDDGAHVLRANLPPSARVHDEGDGAFTVADQDGYHVRVAPARATVMPARRAE